MQSGRIRLRKRLVPDEGYDLAKFQRPGVKIVMGPEFAREEWLGPLELQTVWERAKLPMVGRN